MTVRLFSPRRAVLRLGRRCLAVHSRPPDWHRLFTSTLDLLMIGAEPMPGGLRIGDGAGTLAWRGSRFWTLIEMDLTGFSAKKRSLVVAGLVKAARYPQPGRTHAERFGDSRHRRSAEEGV